MDDAPKYQETPKPSLDVFYLAQQIFFQDLVLPYKVILLSRSSQLKSIQRSFDDV